MSWLSDRYSDFVSTVGSAGKFVAENNLISYGAKALGHQGNGVADFFQNEFIDKKDLRGAEIMSVMSGLPIVGNIVKGVEGVSQLEDLYARTGKVPEYPSQMSPGAGGLGKAIGGLTRKIENGTHDLAEYYSGEKLGPMPVEGVDYVTGDKYVNQ